MNLYANSWTACVAEITAGLEKDFTSGEGSILHMRYAKIAVSALRLWSCDPWGDHVSVEQAALMLMAERVATDIERQMSEGLDGPYLGQSEAELTAKVFRAMIKPLAQPALALAA